MILKRLQSLFLPPALHHGYITAKLNPKPFALNPSPTRCLLLSCARAHARSKTCIHTNTHTQTGKSCSRPLVGHDEYTYIRI